jgi:hypothetical protein
MNKIRRHLNISQWAEVGTHPETVRRIAEAAAKRKAATQFGSGTGNIAGTDKLDTETGATDAIIADTVGVSERTVRMMNRVREDDTDNKTGAVWLRFHRSRWDRQARAGAANLAEYNGATSEASTCLTEDTQTGLHINPMQVLA